MLLPRIILLFFLFLLIIEYSSPLQVHAQSLKSNGYRLDIDWNELNNTDRENRPYPETTSLIPTKGYLLEQRTHKDDSRIVGFELTKQDESSVRLTLTANNSGISASMGSLAEGDNTYGILPPTHCDDKKCSYKQAGTWTHEDTLGFGYSLKGHFTPSDFSSPNSFRPLSNPHNSEKPAVLFNRFILNDSEFTITFKDKTKKGGLPQGIKLTVLPWY